MSDQTPSLKAVFIDGETKTGKGAASKAIADALAAADYQVYYDVAGDYYRRYVALVRHHLQLDEATDLPTGPELLAAATEVYNSKQAYEPHLDLGDLQRPAISKSVAVLGELPLAQQSGAEWYALSLKLAHDAQADVIVLDGRNPRARVADELAGLSFPVQTALDLYMICGAEEAARRSLWGRGLTDFSDEELAQEVVRVTERRERDRQRADRPFVAPDPCLQFNPAQMSAAEAIDGSWQLGADLPATIMIDNTTLTIDVMLKAVSDLALSAVTK